jgi:hypothetical protein
MLRHTWCRDCVCVGDSMYLQVPQLAAGLWAIGLAVDSIAETGPA